MKISAVINTLNAEKSLNDCLSSLKDFGDEIVVCDDGSTDRTFEIAKKYTDKIFYHKSAGFVEQARNYAVSKAENEWVFIIDADERLPKTLAQRLKQLVLEVDFGREDLDYVLIPRKNLIFGKWIKHTGWWPDYNTRFFKKEKVIFSGVIHEQPTTEGKGFKLPEEEKFAIIHQNYNSISDYVERMNRYTSIEADYLAKNHYVFKTTDLIKKPTSEFLSRFFAKEGFKDGIHGLALSVLQAFSFFVTYLKAWESEGSNEQEIDLNDLKKTFKDKTKEGRFWLFKTLAANEKGVKKTFYKILKRI